MGMIMTTDTLVGTPDEFPEPVVVPDFPPRQRRQPTIDDLLDLRLRMTYWHQENYYANDRGGMDVALEYLDNLLASL